MHHCRAWSGERHWYGTLLLPFFRPLSFCRNIRISDLRAFILNPSSPRHLPLRIIHSSLSTSFNTAIIPHALTLVNISCYFFGPGGLKPLLAHDLRRDNPFPRGNASLAPRDGPVALTPLAARVCESGRISPADADFARRRKIFFPAKTPPGPARPERLPSRPSASMRPPTSGSRLLMRFRPEPTISSRHDQAIDRRRHRPNNAPKSIAALRPLGVRYMGRITNLLKAATGVIGWHLPPGKDRRGKSAKAPAPRPATQPRGAGRPQAAECYRRLRPLLYGRHGRRLGHRYFDQRDLL